MDSITGEVITTQEISGDVLPTQEIDGNVNLPATCGATTWQELTLKPFETLSTDFYVDDGVLHVNGGGTSSNAVWYPSVSDNGDISWVKNDSETAPTSKNIKGTNGFSPTISVYESTDTSYKLTVTDVNGSYQTPNLKSGGGSGGSISWGDITGTLADQTDLNNALSGKAPISHSHTVSQITDFPSSMPASDVSAWAKSPTKPTYAASEVGALPDTTVIPTKTSQLANDSNFATDLDLSNKVDKVTGKSLMSDTEIERLASVVNYNDTTVQAHMSNTDIHVTSTNKTNWDSKANGTHTHVKVDITDFPTIPTVTNDLTNELKNNYNAAYTHSQSTHAPSNAEQNVQADWSQTDTNADDFIKNKPTIPTEYTLPTASTAVKGGIKVDGTSITVDENGVASASGGGIVTETIAESPALNTNIVTLTKALSNFRFLILCSYYNTNIYTQFVDINKLIQLNYPRVSAYQSSVTLAFTNTTVYCNSTIDAKIIGVY